MVTFALVVLLAIPPQKAAAIERDQEKAQREVAEKYGNKKSSQLSADERRQMSKDQAAADRQVLEKHKVDAKEWASSQAHRSRDEREEVKQEKVKQAEKEKADDDAAKKKAAAAAGGEKPIPIQHGFSDSNPVVLEEKSGAKPLVEEGLPADVKADQEAAAEFDRQNGGGGGEPKPTGMPRGK